MANVPPLENPIWINIVTGKAPVNFKFVAANILMMRIKSNIGQHNSSSDIGRYADELRELFIANSNNPVARQDIAWINESCMVKGAMHDIKSVQDMILEGRRLMLAGDESLLAKLPRGRWIGGTIPYFISEKGGLFSRNLIFVTEIPDYCGDVNIKMYNEKELEKVYIDAPGNGFSFIIIPALSKIHLGFALNAPNYKNFAVRPLAGWVSGVFLDDVGKINPKVFNGTKPEAFENKAAVMHVSLPDDRVALLNIFNIFEQGPGETLEFTETGFSARDVLVNGEKQNFEEFIFKNKLDIKFPLIADYYGIKTNVGFHSIDYEESQVRFYAPVFKGLKYKYAKPMGDYVKNFTAQVPKEKAADVVFSCNCILNYIHSQLEGKITGEFTGPVSFGEIAYQLLNQTMVYLKIKKIEK